MTSAAPHPGLYEGNRVLTVKFSAASQTCHHVFFAAHRVQEPCPEKPLGRTLFCSNIPPWASAPSLKRLFQSNGPVDRVILQRTPTPGAPPAQEPTRWQEGRDARVGCGFKYAYVVFERPSSVRNAMEKMDARKTHVLSTHAQPIETGVEKWRREYNAGLAQDLDALMAEIEASVAEMDVKKADEVKEAEEEFGEADEDGWVTVSRHTSKKPVGKISDKAQKKVKAREARKRKRKELEHFYKHQVKQSKLARLNELKEKFEQDKQKQLAMKSDRKFKPT